MIRFQRLFAFIFAVGISFSCFAQDSLLSIDEICSSLTQNKVTSGDFVQEKTSPRLSRPLRSSGYFLFCDKGIVWASQKPFKTTTVITENSIIQTNPSGKKSVMDGSSNEIFKSVAATLSTLFTGDKTALETYFNISDFKSDSSSWKMILIPKDKTISSAILQIELSGAAKGKNASLDSMKILQTGDSSTSYTLSNQIYSQELSDEQKKFFE